MSQPNVVHPELITQLEREFAVHFDARMLVTWTRRAGPTVGATPTEVYAWVTRTLADAKVRVPDDCWPRVREWVMRAAMAATTATKGFKTAT